jgi:hypothetical protein
MYMKKYKGRASLSKFGVPFLLKRWRVQTNHGVLNRYKSYPE